MYDHLRVQSRVRGARPSAEAEVVPECAVKGSVVVSLVCVVRLVGCRLGSVGCV